MILPRPRRKRVHLDPVKRPAAAREGGGRVAAVSHSARRANQRVPDRDVEVRWGVGIRRGSIEHRALPDRSHPRELGFRMSRVTTARSSHELNSSVLLIICTSPSQMEREARARSLAHPCALCWHRLNSGQATDRKWDTLTTSGPHQTAPPTEESPGRRRVDYRPDRENNTASRDGRVEFRCLPVFPHGRRPSGFAQPCYR